MCSRVKGRNVAGPNSKYPAGQARGRPSARASQYSTARVLAAAAVCGCTGFESPSDTLTASEINGLTSNEPSAEWGCLDPRAQPAALPVFSESVARIIYSLQVVDLSTGQIYADARVRACVVADINCENPVTDALPVDSGGWVDLPLFRDFTGFLEVTSSEAVPYLFYLSEPLTESTVEYPLTLISLASLGPLVQLVGVQPQQDTGVIAVRSFDCAGNTASGVVVSTENLGTPYYFIDGLPTGMGSESGADGLGGLVNVVPGLVVVDAKAPTGASIRGPQSVVVRPNWLSVVYVRPPAGRRLPQ
jgi:hypothetical protein